MTRARSTGEAAKIRDKVEGDLEATAAAVVRAGKFLTRLAVEPKMDLAKKFIRAVLGDEVR